jgi:transcriptional regulator with XRE-family HTH domain
LRNKAYRDGYTEAQLSIEVPFQIRALRKARGWTQAQLAERCGIPQARISHIEQPGRGPLSLRTLYRLSAAFDVGLLVQFVPFSELMRREATFDPETFHVPSFEEDQAERAVRSTDTPLTAASLKTEPDTTSASRSRYRLPDLSTGQSGAEDPLEVYSWQDLRGVIYGETETR